MSFSAFSCFLVVMFAIYRTTNSHEITNTNSHERYGDAPFRHAALRDSSAAWRAFAFASAL